MTLAVVLAEDNYLVREGVAALLTGSGAIELKAVAEDYPSLLAAVVEHRPDAVLTDIRMPPGHTTEGIEAAKFIRSRFPETGVVVLSQYADAEYAFALLDAGASGLGYLLKERISHVDDVIAALREVARGGSVLDPKVVEALVNRQLAVTSSPLGRLTRREYEVLELMAQGKNNAGIAAAMVLTERAVENYINALFHKLMLTDEKDTHRRVMAVLTLLRATGQAGA